MAVRVPSKGTVLKKGGVSSAAAYVAVAQVRGIGDIGGESDEIDVTDLDSTAKEFLMGLPDNGIFEVTLAFDPATAAHTDFFALQKSQALNYWQIVLANAASYTWQVAAYVKSFKITGMTPGGVIEAKCGLRISGSITDAT